MDAEIRALERLCAAVGRKVVELKDGQMVIDANLVIEAIRLMKIHARRLQIAQSAAQERHRFLGGWFFTLRSDTEALLKALQELAPEDEEGTDEQEEMGIPG